MDENTKPQSNILRRFCKDTRPFPSRTQDHSHQDVASGTKDADRWNFHFARIITGFKMTCGMWNYYGKARTISFVRKRGKHRHGHMTLRDNFLKILLTKPNFCVIIYGRETIYIYNVQLLEHSLCPNSLLRWSVLTHEQSEVFPIHAFIIIHDWTNLVKSNV